MEEQKLALKNLILKVRVGSNLYGTSTSESDEDFIGIFVPNAEYLLGLKRVEEVDLGVISKGTDGKNTKDAIDFKVYTLEKFARLALDNNPNILEILFVNSDSILFINDVGKQLLNMRYEFLSKRIKHRFLGYAFSQKHKMIIKLENYEKLLEAVKYLDNNTDKQFLLDIEHHPIFVRKKDHVAIGDMNIPITVTTKKAKKMLVARINKFGSRKELVSKYGFDTKFASNLIRLLKEGQELLFTGDLKFPLQSKELLKDIRYGKYSMNDILSLSDVIEKEVEDLYDTTKLQNSPNRKLVEKFVIETHKKYI
jgi:predicted nucleotidyltransferase